VPRGIEWKVGVSRALGWPARDQADLARTWQRILGSVKYRDLDPALLGRVEELIDFVTADSLGGPTPLRASATSPSRSSVAAAA
jgi:hypothetical protein